MRVNIFNQSTCLSINRRKIISFVKRVLREEKFKLSNLNIVITNNSYLKKLNRMFLNKNRTTNVISFNLDDVSEIYVSCDKIKNIEQLYYYIIHGMLHIIGYDHKNKTGERLMDEKCLRYLEYASADDSKV